MEKSDSKIITVLLTRYYDKVSNFIYYITGRGYTHASISLGEGEDCFYSFNFKGFRIEHPGKHREKVKMGESVAYRLAVTEEEYERISHYIEKMKENSAVLSYSSFGVFLCMLRIPFKMKNRYFCSQFVAETLQQTKSVQLRKKASLYFPNELPKVLERQSCLREILYNPI
ncbi:MAG: hypothetical protein PHC41_09015 [Lachnospiraceae bacterium]|nr:hypothetical protein [Lachnospiraceae bacterium]MDD3616349.1 hypothetical protein [Lachnospiraceae bacterium]